MALELAAALGDMVVGHRVRILSSPQGAIVSWGRTGVAVGAALAFDAAGQPDSARVYYEASLEERQFLRMESDQFYLAAFLERLAELELEAGEPRGAVQYYAEFVELWSGADAELQPRVNRARERLDAILADVG